MNKPETRASLDKVLSILEKKGIPKSSFASDIAALTGTPFTMSFRKTCYRWLNREEGKRGKCYTPRNPRIRSAIQSWLQEHQP